jgi:nucleotide-binding universal stress UspA family protein
VALARALAYEPNVLLLDEPFGALDVRTRSQLRRSLKEVQQKLRVTAILVTHDQEEAFELADRIGVLDRGRLLEVGSPEALYTKPRTLFAATFLGAGTVLVGRVNQGKACLGPLELPIPPETPHDDGAPVQVLFRPEQVRLSADRPPESELVFGQGTIVEQNFSGPLRRIRLRLPRLPGTRQISPAIPFGEEGMLIDSVIPSATRVESSTSWVAVEGWHVLEQGQTRLLVFADGEATDEMLPLARWMVERMNASATLLTVARSQEEVESVREEMAERQHQAGLDEALLRARIGDPVEQIYLEENEALYSFVMLAPRADDGAAADEGPRRSGSASRPRRLLSRLGTTVTRLLENPAVPVMVVKKERPAIRRMLICTAAGEPGKNDARVGGRLARHFGAAVTLLYVTGGSDSASPLARAHLEHAAATLESLDVPVETRVVAAKSPARGIIAEARSGDHDLVVIGNHGPQYRSIFGRDDVTLQVLVGTDRPVLIVPEHLLTN